MRKNKNNKSTTGPLAMLAAFWLAALLPFLPVAASAEPVDAAWLARINQALKAIPPLSGRFQQKLPNGGHAEGVYAMDWPDRLRFAYDVGGESIVTVKGKFVAVQETPGGEPNWFPVALTPLSVLRRAIAEGIDAPMVTNLSIRTDNYSITLEDPSGDLPGQAELFFTRQGDRLYAWRLTDVQNLVTLVRLSEIIVHEKLANSRFDIIEDDPDDE